jgi:MFS family permease
VGVVDPTTASPTPAQAVVQTAPPSTEKTPTPTARTLLKERTFRRYWSAQTISYFGDQVSMLAMPLLAVLVLHATPAQMGLLTAAGLAANLVLSLPAGVWIDRRRHRRYVMITSDLIRALLLASIPVAYAFGQLTLVQLYLVAFGIGAFSILFELSNATMFVCVVPPAGFVTGNSLINGSRSLSFVGGPALGGFLVQLLSAPVALIADSVSYLGSAFNLVRIRPAEPPPEHKRGGQLSAGLKFLASSRVLWQGIVAVATVNLFNFMFWALVILYVTTYLGVSPGLLGVVIAVASVGGLLGATITGRVVRAIGVGPAYVVGLIVFPLPLVLVPAAGGPRPLVLTLLVLAEFTSGLGVMILDISFGSISAALIPARLRARVAGTTRTLNYGIRPVGALIGGGLGSAIGVRTTLWVATIGAVFGVLWLIGSPILRLRTLPEPDEAREAEPVSAG